MFKRILLSSIIVALPAFVIADEAKAPKTYEQIEGTFSERIENGVKNGSLTAHEAEKLMSQRARLEQIEARMKAGDNTVSPEERELLDKATRKLSKKIYKEKHDGQEVIAIRNQNEKARINAGVKDGSLTAKEAKQLRKQMKEKRELAKQLRSDGELSKADRKVIARENRRVSKAIYKQRHDKQERKKAKRRAASK